jgi:hypothetical protein
MGRMWEHHADRWLVTMWGAGSGVLVALAACWTLARRDFY